MVTPPRNQPNTKMLQQGGEHSGNKRFHHNNNQVKRSQSNKTSNTLAPHHQMLQASSSAPQKGRHNHHPHRSKPQGNPQQHPNRTSPTHHQNNTNNYYNNKNQQQQRPNNQRQTPPRQIVNQVNMNNGQPSLVELTTLSNQPANTKNVVKSSQKQPLQDNAFRKQKGQTMPSHGSRSSPVSTKSNRASPQGFAGSKCFEPPTPNSLPKPPSDWTPFQFPTKQNLFGNLDILTFGDMAGSNNADIDNHSTARDVSQELKLILQANA
jgi:hypothetical protein